MIPIYSYKEVPLDRILTRDNTADDQVNDQVKAILEAVRKGGDKALLDCCARFDGGAPDPLEVPREELEEACRQADPAFVKILEEARDHIADFHRRQLHNNFFTTGRDGVMMGQRYTPIEKVGLYVPGGTASYPSTVLMDAVPAKIAGVSQIIMATPPGKDGKVRPEILTAAVVAGVDRVFRMGGAHAVAAMAYGTETVPKVYKIVGPGNIYVSCAKRFVYGAVDIDMIAGPSEILIVADEGCNPRWVAADLLSQAEHDKLASAVLVTPSRELALGVQQELERQIPLLERAEIARASIDQNGRIILVEDLRQGVEAANEIAPEHLELAVADPFGLLSLVKNAGSIFLGRHVPEALGDYFAGPNHTLPTSGTARFSSPLSVDDFVKKSSFIYYTPEALAREGQQVMGFARQEGLGAHARSVEVRLEKEETP